MDEQNPRRGRPRKSIPTGDLANKLRSIAARAQEHSSEGEEIKAEREKLIRRALAAGWAHREIANLSGLSYQRIGQIAQSRQTLHHWLQEDEGSDQ